MKRIISVILAVSMISGMSGFQTVYAVESDSEITISDETMPEGLLKEGESFGLRGIISSKYNLSKVDAEICIQNTENTVQYASANPDTTTFNINPDINYSILFRNLERGSYTYILNAEDVKGYKKNLIKSDFEIVDINDITSDSEITISDETMPEGTLKEGESFGLRGIISSKYNLSKVDAEIRIQNTDKSVQYTSVNPDATTFNINPDINYSIVFRNLERGSYTYILNAEDIKGYKKNLVKSDFRIGDTDDIKGDVNSDGIVDIADVVAIALYIGDFKNNPLDSQGIINADVHGDGDGITTGDVLMIQQYLAGIVENLEGGKPAVTTTATTITTTTTTTTVTTTAIQTENTVSSSEQTVVTLGLSDFVSDSYYKCYDKNASSDELDSMCKNITSGEYSVEELMLNLINYKFGDDRGQNPDYIYCLYNSMLKREPSESEVSERISQIKSGKSRFALFLEVAKSAEFKGICQKYNISSYRASLENISDTVSLDATHDIYEDNSFSSEILGTAQSGQILSVIGFKGEWFEVKFLDGKGYIKQSFVSPYGNSLTKVLAVPNIPQNSYVGGTPLPTGCEVTSLATLMNYLGFENCGKNNLANNFMPKGSIGSTDPNYAFIGSPESGSSYGAYANAMVRTADNYFSAYDINNYHVQDITGADMSELYSRIDKGNPVLVWITMYCTSSRTYGATWTLQRGTYYTEPGTGTYSFTWKRNEHCCVLVGYNKAKGTVILADVLEGDALTEYNIPEFESAYRWLGNQAVIITEQK